MNALKNRLFLQHFLSNMDSFKIIVFSLFFINSISGSKICDVKDTECTKRGVTDIYPLFINGIDDIVESSDPIVINATVKADLPTIKYKLENAQLAGMKKCSIETMNIFKENSTFQFYLQCPQIVGTADYDMIGYVGEKYVVGEGNCTVTCDDYIMNFDGYFKKFKGKDNKDHVTITKYFIDVKSRGKVEFIFANLFDGDKEKSDDLHKYLNENWQIMDKALRAPAINGFMEIFIDHLNDFLKAIPVEQIFPSLA